MTQNKKISLRISQELFDQVKAISGDKKLSKLIRELLENYVMTNNYEYASKSKNYFN